MELTIWRLEFLNGKEFVVKSSCKTVDELLNKLTESGGFFKSKGFIALQKVDGSDPVYIRSHNLFSAQSVRAESIGSQTKIWSIL